MTTEVMIDLETLSVEPDSAIISIGAVKFNPRGDIGTLKPDDGDEGPYEHFYQNVDFASLSGAGFRMSGDTIAWWMGSKESSPTQDVRADLFKDAVGIDEALSRFFIWYGDNPKLPVWGNGADFDNVLLTTAYKIMGGIPPWDRRGNRCFRTLKALYPDVPYIGAMRAHNALADAEAQALHVQKLFSRIPRSIA